MATQEEGISSVKGSSPPDLSLEKKGNTSKDPKIVKRKSSIRPQDEAVLKLALAAIVLKRRRRRQFPDRPRSRRVLLSDSFQPVSWSDHTTSMMQLAISSASSDQHRLETLSAHLTQQLVREPRHAQEWIQHTITSTPTDQSEAATLVWETMVQVEPQIASLLVPVIEATARSELNCSLHPAHLLHLFECLFVHEPVRAEPTRCDWCNLPDLIAQYATTNSLDGTLLEHGLAALQQQQILWSQQQLQWSQQQSSWSQYS